MNKVIFYGSTIRTLSMAEGLKSACPQCSVCFPCASEINLPPFGTVIQGNPEIFFEDTDFVVIEQPLAQSEETLLFLRKYLPSSAFVLELQPVKADIYRIMERHLEGVCRFAGAYVFADFGERIIREDELRYARGDLFRNKITALVCDNQPSTLEALKNFWDLLGARIIPTSPEFFDEITANTMSAGMLLASMYVQILQRDSWADTLFFGFYNKGLRQATNGVSENPSADAEALLRNKENISHVLSFFKREIQVIERLLAEENLEKLSLYLEQAQKFQDRI